MKLISIVIAVVFCGIECILLGFAFEMSVISQGAIAVLSLAGLLLALWRGVYAFYTAMLVGLTAMIALGCGVGSAYEGESPLRINVVLGPWVIFGLSLLLAGGAVWRHERGAGGKRFPMLLAIAFLVDWVLLSVNVAHFQDWMLENALTVPFAILIVITHKWFRLSNVSYGLIFVFMVLHIIGTHYTYSEVPVGFWLKEALDLPRNHYDRIVHFSFGLLMAYPMREVALRIGSVRGFWGLYVPIEFVLATSAIYEIIEWLIAEAFGGDLGIAYLGTQGDPWDAIKDMALAGTGSVIAMTVVFAMLLALGRSTFWREFRESLKIKQPDALGEQAVERMRRGG